MIKTVLLALSAVPLANPALAADQLPPYSGGPEELFSVDKLRGAVGLRYWYSQAASTVKGANATIETDNATGHSLELVGQVEDTETRTSIKGFVGLGQVTDGKQTVRNVNSTSWNAKSLPYLVIDAGWEVAATANNSARLKAIVGYHFLKDKLSADYGSAKVEIGNEWHALRLGVSADGTFSNRLSWSVDAAAVPWSYNEVDDQFVKLTSMYTYGFEADAMVNVALTPNWDIGVGGRYWWLHSEYELDQSHDYQRYGLLVESKYLF